MYEMPIVEVVGLFPSLQPLGGVQASGRDAWQGIVNQIGEQRACFVGYEPGASKTRVALAALAQRRQGGILLVWHLHLLKLAPLVAGAAARVVVFLHGIEAWRQQDSLTRWALGKVNLFLSNSDHTWEQFAAFNPALRATPHETVHLGAGTSLASRPPAPAAKPVALMLGRMLRSEDYKGHRQMIESWPRVLELVPDAELWVAGDGDLRPALEQLALKLGLGSRVRFWGQISEEEKQDLIARCRCVAMPSSGEGFGLVYLEAMRIGRPCLVSDRDAGREVVNPPEAGLAVNPDDPLQLAAAVTRLLTPGPDWDVWSIAARRRYESRFTAQHFRERLNAALFALQVTHARA
jgi:phosphatidylinositol alpha-1,6-mannosyltransferase